MTVSTLERLSRAAARLGNAVPRSIRGRIRAIFRLPRHVHEWYVQPLILRRNVEHVHGPAVVEYGRDEVLLICVVWNGAYYIRSFIEYHLGLGVRHIVFLDTGSTDVTVSIACEYHNVTVLRTTLPYGKYENVIKRYLARRFSSGRWNLIVDIDEQFDYPHSDVLSLRSFLGYLNKRSYTAVVAQMLDMFSAVPLSQLPDAPEESLREMCPLYDLAGIRKIDFRFGRPGHPEIREHRDGIRHALFGTHNGLSKTALVFVDDQVELFVGWHHVRRARIADLSCVLLHYPFIKSFYTKVKEAVSTRRYGYFTIQYQLYWNWLERNPQGVIVPESAERLTEVNQLVERGFLVVSEDYRRWVEQHARQADRRLLGAPKSGAE